MGAVVDVELGVVDERVVDVVVFGCDRFFLGARQ